MTRNYSTEQLAAWAKVAELKSKFVLVEPDACEVCGVSVAELRKSRKRWYADVLQAHHWNGYERPEQVWWVCPSCHVRMRFAGLGHDGQNTLEEVRNLLARPTPETAPVKPRKPKHETLQQRFLRICREVDARNGDITTIL